MNRPFLFYVVFLVGVIGFTDRASAQVNPAALDRSIARLSGLLGVNLLPDSRVKTYDGKTPSGQDCVVQVELFGSERVLSGVSVTVGLSAKNGFGEQVVSDSVHFSLSQADTQTIHGLTAWNGVFMTTGYQHPQTRELQHQTIEIDTRAGRNSLAVSLNGKQIACRRQVTDSKP